MGDFVIRPVDIFEIIKRHKSVMGICFASAFSLVMFTYIIAPRSYRSEATIHIGVSYFQNPLIGDLISQTHDPGELRAEREKIIRSALGVDFAKKMGEKHSLFKGSADDKNRATEIEYFLKSLDVVPITSTQFTLKYKGRKPQVVDDILRSAIDSIRNLMYGNRVRMLDEFYSVLQDEIVSAGGTSTRRALSIPELQAESQAKVSAEKTQIAAQVEVLEKRLSDLQRAYSANHPSVQAAKSEISELRALENGGALSARITRRRMFGKSSRSSVGGVSNIRDDLEKQEHLLRISLEMEKKDPTMSSYVTVVKEPIFPKSPVFPKLRLFLLTALIMGVMAATVGLAVTEFWLRVEIAPQNISDILQSELFGAVTLPESHRQ